MHTTTCKFCRIFFRNRSRAISILSTRFVVTPPGITADTMFCISSSVYNPGLVPSKKKNGNSTSFFNLRLHHFNVDLKSKTIQIKDVSVSDISNQNSPFNINNYQNQCCRERERERTNPIFLDLFLHHSHLHSSDRLHPVDSLLPGPRESAGPWVYPEFQCGSTLAWCALSQSKSFYLGLSVVLAQITANGRKIKKLKKWFWIYHMHNYFLKCIITLL